MRSRQVLIVSPYLECMARMAVPNAAYHRLLLGVRSSELPHYTDISDEPKFQNSA